MEFLGIGPLELLLIAIIILLVAGPGDMQKAARNLGRSLNRLYRSPNYQAIRRASSELRNLPNRLAREAQLDELTELKQTQRELEETARTIGQAAPPYRAWVEDLASGAGAPTGPGQPSAADRTETPAAPASEPQPSPPAEADRG
jgi:sec-independent protein translocase protein TatB